MKTEERYQRYKYLTGLSAWEIASYQDPNHIVVLNDGPSGLRKPIKQGFNEQEETIVAVCMPTPSALAASFDENICYRDGQLLAQTCLYHGTNILLAPGVNVKRYPLCGRNFEYFSEDPFLAGKLASQYINGLEDSGVGACVKHYACNSQEHARTINSSEVSLRALNEIYLRVFKYIFKFSKPTSVMTSYNKINDEYVNESTYLIQDKLRNEYGFNGLIISDWCAVSNKWKGIKVGLDIEMPLTRMSSEYIDRGYMRDFDDNDLLARDERIYQSLRKFKKQPTIGNLDMDQMHNASVELANDTLVLLKNERNYFPIKPSEKILVLGYFGNHSRFVGGGSGWVNAYKPQTLVNVLENKGVNYEFIQAYDEDKLLITDIELKQYQKRFDKVVLLMGQYQKDEEEGKDRNKLDLDNNQVKLLKMVKECFGKVGVVLISGSVVNLEEVYASSEALLLTYLAGEGQAEAIYNNLFGLHNPSGRLPETWISSIYQNPIMKEYLRRDIYHTYYYDDIYVGYRYYDLHEKGFLLPFGYGLSYASFNYDNYNYELTDDKLKVSLDITNISDVDGAEVIQIYVGKKDSQIYRPLKELKGFKKVFIKKGEKVTLNLILDLDDLKAYRSKTDTFEVEDGNYEIYIALNVKQVLDCQQIKLSGNIFEPEVQPVLTQKSVPSKYTVDSPAGLLFFNEDFKEYVIKHQLPIDIEDFENKHWYLDTKTFRGLINDNFFAITFEQLEGLIDYLNSQNKGINKCLNFDEHVGKFMEITKW